VKDSRFAVANLDSTATKSNLIFQGKKLGRYRNSSAALDCQLISTCFVSLAQNSAAVPQSAHGSTTTLPLHAFRSSANSHIDVMTSIAPGSDRSGPVEPEVEHGQLLFRW
jgi:hypothetical protein